MRFLILVLIITMISCNSQSENSNTIAEDNVFNNTSVEFETGEFSEFISNLYSKQIGQIMIDYERPDQYIDETFLDNIKNRKYYDENLVRKIVRPYIYTINPDREYFYLFYYRLFDGISNPINLRVLEKDNNGNLWEYYVGKNRVEYIHEENTLYLNKVENITPSNSELYRFTKKSGDVNSIEGSYQTILTHDNTQLITPRFSPIVLIITKIDTRNGRYILTYSDASYSSTFDGSLLLETINGHEYFADVRNIDMNLGLKREDFNRILFFVYPGNERIIGIEEDQYNQWLREWNENGRRGSPLDYDIYGYTKNWGDGYSIYVDATENHFNIKLQQRDVDAIWSGFFEVDWNR